MGQCMVIIFKCYARLAFNAYPTVIMMAMMMEHEQHGDDGGVGLGEAQSSRHFATIKVWS